MKNLFYFLFMLVTSVAIISCNEDESPSGETIDNAGTIADFVAGNAEYSSLQSAIERTGLGIYLDGVEPHTLLAPNNRAFQGFLLNNGFSDIDDVPLEALTDVMLNHLISSQVSAAELPSYKISSEDFLEFNLSLYTSNSSLINGKGQVVNGDISASNGLIHSIDSILPLPTLLTHIRVNENFSIMEEALIAASAGNNTYLNLLDSEYPKGYTVFVPNNDAFELIFQSLGVAGISEINVLTLRKLINYHLFPLQNLRSGDVSQSTSITTLQGEDLVFDLSNGIQLIDAVGEAATIITPNIQGVNGVLHEVDKVLLSQEIFEILVPTLMQQIRVDATLSMLEEALDITGLNELLDDRSASLTIMAPPNFAFNAYLDGEDIDDLPVDVLTQLLKNHVLSGRRYVADFETGYQETAATFDDTNSPLSLYVNNENELSFNGNVEVLEGDIETANGNIHLLNRVIAVPTVLTFIVADPDLDIIQSVFFFRPNVPDYDVLLMDEIGEGEAPFTVFTPTDEAFQALYLELDINSLGNVDDVTLTAILNTHIVTGSSIRAEDIVSGPLVTLGDIVTMNASNTTITDQNSRVSNIVFTNIQGSNGVVHKLDRVLLAN